MRRVMLLSSRTIFNALKKAYKMKLKDYDIFKTNAKVYDECYRLLYNNLYLVISKDNSTIFSYCKEYGVVDKVGVNISKKQKKELHDHVQEILSKVG